MSTAEPANVAGSGSGAPLAVSRPRRVSVHGVLLAGILLGSLALKLHNLDHAWVKPLDEAYHAIVARNFLRHPLTPTLYDHPYLSADATERLFDHAWSFQPTHWMYSHIWLHKPPMALWQIALSYALLGINTLALRLPSALLSTLAVWLTYLIGRELLDRTAGLIAAALQAFNPTIVMLVQGYLFSDHVDIALLFYTELGILFLARAMRAADRRSRRREALLCGVAQGLAVLSKSYLGLLVTGLALVAWLWPWVLVRVRPGKANTGDERWRGLSGGQFGMIVAAMLVVALPWNLYALIHWPQQYLASNSLILQHLSGNVENWAGPWDRLMFGYWIAAFRAFYVPMLAAVIIVSVRAVQGGRRHLGQWLVLAWAVGVLAPHLLATSKTPTGTLIGWPACWLLLGNLVSNAVRGDRWALGAWAIASVLAAMTLTNGGIPDEGWGYDSANRFGMVMWEHAWVLWHLAAALAGGAAIAWAVARAGESRQRLYWALVAAASIAMVVSFLRWPTSRPRRQDLAIGYVRLAWNATRPADRGYTVVGDFGRLLPDDAVFLVVEREKLQYVQIMFATDHTAYPVTPGQWPSVAQRLGNAHALPYLLSGEPVAGLPALLSDPLIQQTLYACTPNSLAAAQHIADRLHQP